MSEQDRYRGSAAQRGQNRAGDSQWQRDYGQRNPRFDSFGRSLPPSPDYSRQSGLARELRGNDYPRWTRARSK